MREQMYVQNLIFFLNFFHFHLVLQFFFFILQLSIIDFSMKGLSIFNIFEAFLFKNVKNFFLNIIECLNISAYPQINSLFGSVFKKLVSDTTKVGW